jgi:hypothetical protein
MMPPKKPLMPPNNPRPLPPPPASQVSTSRVVFQAVGRSTMGHRTVIYGTGGIGKSTLTCQAPGKCAFVDAEESLGKLKSQLESASVPVPVLIPAHDWLSLRAALSAEGYDGIKNVIIDTGTKIEEWCIAHTLKTVRNDKNLLCSKIEDFGYGKGYRYVYDTFLPLLGDLDRHARAGRNVFIVCHDDAKVVPNPSGLDWLRWEPKMQDSKGCSIRYKLKEWSDHTLFYAYEVEVDDQGNKKARTGKGKGSGSRVIYTAELPHFMAKSRTTSETILVDGSDVWSQILK